MLLRQLQALLAGLYDAPAEQDVNDYLITDAAHAAVLQGAERPPTDEQLLIAESDGQLEIGLYVDASVLERLASRCPLRRLTEDNLADYCTALEGVSHFHYVVWSVARDRSVSLLELELQAEVDKYASALRLTLEQRDGRFPAELFHRLFDRTGFLPHLTGTERSRYEEAHRFAARFCRRLEDRFLRPRRARPEAMLAELRTFYRLGRHAKLRHAAQWG
ncbi:MAG: hypothetical protein FIB04_07380 [Gammaproteobacteria bacterium]|nr:hypothetical protein [Gammaproteobacteria bacterium]